MSKHFIYFEKEITIAKGTQSDYFDPADFINCKDEDELQYEIIDAFYNTYYYEGDISVYESETSLKIPESFIEEWKQLKNKQYETENTGASSRSNEEG